MIILFLCILLAIIAYGIYRKLSKSVSDKPIQNIKIDKSNIDNSFNDAKNNLENIYKDALFQAITIKEDTPYFMFTYNKDLSQFRELLPDKLMVTFLKDLGEVVEKEEIFAIASIDDYLFQIKASHRGYIYWEEESKKVLFVTNGNPICMIMIN